MPELWRVTLHQVLGATEHLLPEVYDGQGEESVRHAYYYLHTNNELIYRNPAVVDSMGPYDYFDSDFVKRWWRIDLSNPDELQRFLAEAQSMGAATERIAELKEKWRLHEDNHDDEPE